MTSEEYIRLIAMSQLQKAIKKLISESSMSSTFRRKLVCLFFLSNQFYPMKS